jgi:hypothetical protein
LECAELGGPSCYCRFSKDRHTRYARGDLFKQLQPFAGCPIFHAGKAGGIGAWARQAFDIPGTHWVGDESEYNRDRARHLEQRCEGRAGMGQDNVRGERNQFRRTLAHGLGITATPTVID